MNKSCTIRELLELPVLKGKVRIVTGENDLDRPVKWVHVLEVVDNISELLNGGEMILTTGVGLVNSVSALDFIQQLVNCDIACIAIETSSYNIHISDWIIDLCASRHIPIIEFIGIVRFIEITRECYSYIAGQRNDPVEMFKKQIDAIKDEQGLEFLLDFAANYLHKQIAYITYNGTGGYCTTPQRYREIKSQLTQESARDNPSENKHFLSANVMFWERRVGILTLFDNQHEMGPEDALCLSELVYRVVRHLQYDLFLEERHISERNAWISHWLAGSMTEVDIRNKLSQYGVSYKKIRCLACVSQIKQDGLFPVKETLLIENFSNRAVEAAQVAFANTGLSMIGCIEDDMMVFCVLAPASLADVESRTERIIRDLQSNRDDSPLNASCRFAIGPVVERYEDIGLSYRKAVRTMRIIVKEDASIGLYSRMFGTLMFDALNCDGSLSEYTEDILSPILLPENRDLLQTLFVFFDCNCSKQKTAEKLFIARQTMYFRLQKIQDILGDDFASGEKRFGLEFAVRAYYYLFSTNK